MIVPDTMRTAEPGSFAAGSGFESGKNLNLAFRRICKMSPTEFRSRHQKPADGEG